MQLVYTNTTFFGSHKTRTSKLIVFVILLLLPAAEVCEAREPVGNGTDCGRGVNSLGSPVLRRRGRAQESASACAHGGGENY